jgi:hypothetical protein
MAIKPQLIFFLIFNKVKTELNIKVFCSKIRIEGVGYWMLIYNFENERKMAEHFGRTKGVISSRIKNLDLIW